jgi:hypothetical protein
MAAARTGDRLALLAAISAIAASLAGFIPGVYRDVPAVIVQSHGYDVGNLLVAGALCMALVATARGSVRRRLMAVGALGCLLYSFVTYAFELVVNPVTALYIAVLGLGAWAFVFGFAAFDEAIAEGELMGLRRRTTAGYLAMLAALFAVTWLRQLVGAAIGGVPADLADINWPMNPIWVLDLALVLPLMALTAVRLWSRRGANGVAISLLVFSASLGVTILSMTGSMLIAGQTVDPLTVVLFAVVLLVSGGLAGLALHPTPAPGTAESSGIAAAA